MLCEKCKRIHSHYTHGVADRPCEGRQVKLVLFVRKFFCGTNHRKRHNDESIPLEVVRWQRVISHFGVTVEFCHLTDGFAGW